MPLPPPRGPGDPTSDAEAPIPGVGGRHEARERALGLLYEAEQKELSPAEVVSELPLPPDPFAERLVSGVHKDLARIDGLIARFARNWSLERMPIVDRSILRLGCYELLHESEVPVAVVIDEAVELAKAYSTDEAPAFVNGVLGAIARSLRPEDDAG